MLSTVIVVTWPTVTIVEPHVEGGRGTAGTSSGAGLPRTYCLYGDDRSASGTVE